jgi:hypothetical protein
MISFFTSFFLIKCQLTTTRLYMEPKKNTWTLHATSNSNSVTPLHYNKGHQYQRGRTMMDEQSAVRTGLEADASRPLCTFYLFIIYTLLNFHSGRPRHHSTTLTSATTMPRLESQPRPPKKTAQEMSSSTSLGP